MFCGHCGTAVSENEEVCPNCHMPVKSNVSTGPVEGHVYSSSEDINSQINANSLLVWSIVELLCCNWVFGLIATILYFTSLQNEIKAGNLQGALKAKKTITWVLLGGLIFTIVVSLGSVLFGIGMGILSEL